MPTPISNDEFQSTLERQLAEHEDVRTRPYLDCCGKYWRECTCAKKGKLSIGTGRNLDDVGLTAGEIKFLLRNDILKTRLGLEKIVPGFLALSPRRRMALIDMAFNLGLNGLLKFTNMLAALIAGDYALAASEMLDSQWAKQVGQRAVTLAAMIEEG